MLKLSVIMACYNEEKNIVIAIDSILNQTFTDFEFIIIDDGSLDSTVDIIRRYQEIDDRIVLLRNPINRGHSYSLNVGLHAAKAEFVARMDADDESLLERLQLQYDYLTSHTEIGIVGTGAYLYLKSNKLFLREHFLPEKHEDIVRLKYKNTFFYHPSIMARKEVLLYEGGYNTNIVKSEDVDLWLRLMDKVKFHNIQKPLIKYSVVPGFNKRNFVDSFRTVLTNMIRRGEVLRNLHLIARIVLIMVVYSMGYTPRSYRK